MKFKVFLTSLLAGASLFTANYTKPVYAVACDDPNVQQAGQDLFGLVQILGKYGLQLNKPNI